MIKDRGGEVVEIQFDFRGSQQRVVRYVGPGGDMRQAVVSLDGGVYVADDRPQQAILREEYKRSSGMLAELRLAAGCQRLPGYSEFSEIVRELAKGLTDCVTIVEAAPCNDPRRLDAILQCLEAISISSGSSDVLNLVADGTEITISWKVDEEPPHRSLQISAVRSPG